MNGIKAVSAQTTGEDLKTSYTLFSRMNMTTLDIFECKMANFETF